MKNYIITIIGAAILSSVANILAPSAWIKYIKIITGLIILSVITAPVVSITKINLFSDFSIEKSEINENIQIETISDELKKRIEQDISERIQTEFSTPAKAEVLITVNENNEITGVTHITVTTEADKNAVTARMCEIYGTSKDEVEVNEP